MLDLGLPVPQGFVIANPTAADPAAALKKLKTLFLAVRPSVNGHARGYIEAILNIGLNDETVETLAMRLNDRPMAYDLYRQFIENYAVNVLALHHADAAVGALKQTSLRGMGVGKGPAHMPKEF